MASPENLKARIDGASAVIARIAGAVRHWLDKRLDQVRDEIRNREAMVRSRHEDQVTARRRTVQQEHEAALNKARAGQDERIRLAQQLYEAGVAALDRKIQKAREELHAAAHRQTQEIEEVFRDHVAEIEEHFQEQLGGIEREHAETLEAIQHELGKKRRKARSTRDNRLERASAERQEAEAVAAQELAARCREIDQQLQVALGASTAKLAEAKKRAREDHSAQEKEIEAQARERIRLAAGEFAETRRRIDASLALYVERTGWLHRAFDDTAWQGFRPALQAPDPESLTHVRIGRITADSPWGKLDVPGSVPLLGRSNLLIRLDGSGSQRTRELVQGLLLRILATLPAGNALFSFIDPVALGENVAAFLHLQDHARKLIDEAVRIRPDDIEKCLSLLVDQIAINQTSYLRDDFSSIAQFNAQAAELAVPYRLVVVFGFPTAFETRSLEHLLSILQAGPRCGVHAVIVADPARKMLEGFRLADFEQLSLVLEWDEGKIRLRGPAAPSRLIEPDPAPPKALSRSVLDQVGRLAAEGGGLSVPFIRVAPQPAAVGKATSVDELCVPLGPAGARRLQELRLGRGTEQHGIVAGTTGAGKSNLLHVIITNLSLLYAPGEVELYLVDFKVGVEFKPYALRRLPTARVIAIESEREFGLSVLEGLNQELRRRGELFRKKAVPDVAGYRRASGLQMSRILLIMDEFHELLMEDDGIANRSSIILERLVREGRSMGIHVLLCTQSFEGLKQLPRAVFNTIAVRIALKMNASESYQVLGDNNPAAAGLARDGAAIYNDATGAIEANRPFQIALLESAERDRCLDAVDRLWRRVHPAPPEPVVFEGRELVAPEKNPQILGLRATGSRSLMLWLGEAVALAPPVAIRLNEETGHNVLVLGSNLEMAAGLFATTLLGLAAQLGTTGGRLMLLDLNPSDQGASPSQAAERLGGRIEVGRARDVERLLGAIEEEVKRRLATSLEGRSHETPWILLLFALQRAQMLRLTDATAIYASPDSYLRNEPAPLPLQDRFSKILQDGPMVGIHTLVWCDTLTNARRYLGSLEPFELRVAFQISEADSQMLLDSNDAARLGDHRALFLDRASGKLVKLTPYRFPGDDLIDGLLRKLQS